MKANLIAGILWLFGGVVAYGNDSTYVDTNTVIDTILYQPKDIGYSIKGVSDSTDFEKKLYQSPTLALFKSMLVPGLGQLGNHQYVKAAIVVGLEGWLISSAVHHGRDASDFRDQFNQSIDIAERNRLYSQYLDSKDERNKFTWFAVIVTFVSMWDAYSDAHLSGYPKEKKNNDKDLGINLNSDAAGVIYASISYSF